MSVLDCDVHNLFGTRFIAINDALFEDRASRNTVSRFSHYLQFVCCARLLLRFVNVLKFMDCRRVWPKV